MGSRSKYYPLIRQLFKKPAFTAAEATELGIPRHALAYFEKFVSKVASRYSLGILKELYSLLAPKQAFRVIKF